MQPGTVLGPGLDIGLGIGLSRGAVGSPTGAIHGDLGRRGGDAGECGEDEGGGLHLCCWWSRASVHVRLVLIGIAARG